MHRNVTAANVVAAELKAVVTGQRKQSYTFSF